MWEDPKGDLKNYLKASNTLQIESLVLAEFNMNDFSTISNYGTYRYRPATASSAYYKAPSSYDETDTGQYYSGAIDSYYTTAGFVDQTLNPILFESSDTDRSLYYDLKECLMPFRPRSGINKPLYFTNKYIDSVRSARRPRYYMSSRGDSFKYWNSYRSIIENDEKIEVGVSFDNNPQGFNNSIGYIIEDTCPFVVYDNAIPSNRIVVKMQTNLADITSERNIRISSDDLIVDPLQNRLESSIPQRWKIEYLNESNNWITATAFDENSIRSDGTEIVKWDGHVEIFYGIKVPEKYKESFNLIDYLDFESQLPINNILGDAYIIGATESSAGTLYIWDTEISDWVQDTVSYGFSLLEEDDTKRLGVISQAVDPSYFFDLDGNVVYRDLAFIKGLRVSVETMIAPDTSFDLIEVSPRMMIDISQYIQSFSFNKSIANDATGIPVGGLLASNGDISIFSADGAFTKGNGLSFITEDIVIGKTPRAGSLISDYMKPNIKFIFYETVLNVNGYDKFIPLKTMFSEQFSGTNGGDGVVSIPVRDLFFRIESFNAPQMLLTNVTLTSAVSMILDNIGFSNYIFKGFDDIVVSNGDTVYPSEYPPVPEGRVYAGGSPYFDESTGKLMDKNSAWDYYWSAIGEEYKNKYIDFVLSLDDPVIPYFFVGPDSSVAQVLTDLAVSCQAAMFFDEYNNFVVMPKEYLLPEKDQRVTDLTLYGQVEIEGNDIVSLPNIMQIQNSETKILNDGKISYSIRYIQRSVTSLGQEHFIDQGKTYGYKPVLLWEVGGTEATKTTNEESKQTSEYTLGAAALGESLSNTVPYVENNEIKNNIIYFGENVYWLPRFQSYVYANGEIIRYDAVEYDISGVGKKWIKSNTEYQKYFSSLPFNGKIYPTGNIRIFCEPYYITYDGAPVTGELEQNVTYKNGEVKRHGRGQFGTTVTSHEAGVSETWTADSNAYGIVMDSKYIFSTTPTKNISYPSLSNATSPVGQNNTLARKSSRNGIIKNLFSNVYPSDDVTKTLKTTQTGTIQASALSFNGPSEFDSGISKRDFVSYVYKESNAAFRHYGTRMRLIGKLNNNDNIQTPTNATTYFNVQPTSNADTVNIDGGSGGIAVNINPSTNQGYFFEICALTKDNLENYFKTDSNTAQEESVLHNVIFYKIMKSGSTAIPVKIWGGLAPIIIDDGYFVGMDRIQSEAKPTVYDLAVEWEQIGGTRRFYLYVNGSQIAIADDTNPMPEFAGAALFVRGSSQAMFENIYALESLMARNSGETVINQISKAFSIDSVSSSQSMSKYNVSGFVQSSYLSTISAQSKPKFNIYYDEFGTIMRECSYFNIKYDQAYPALIAKIAETFGNDRGYTVSGFYAGSYGAEFLIFNNTDRALVLNDATGRYLRIIGVTFTQNVTEELTVDSFFSERSNLSDPFIVDNAIKSPTFFEKEYETIKTSRKKYGKKEFNIEPIYVQTLDDANNIMEWLVNKTLKTRESIDISVFGTPHLQLGDIVKINFMTPEGVYFTDIDKQFVVQSIDFSRSQSQVDTVIKVVEI